MRRENNQNDKKLSTLPENRDQTLVHTLVPRGFQSASKAGLQNNI